MRQVHATRLLLTVGFLLTAPLIMSAQYGGQYPQGGQSPQGGQYPPGQYPGGGGMGIPMPSIHLPKRKPKTENAPAKVTVVSLDGTLRHLGEKDLVLQTPSNKILRFRLTADTEFRSKDGKPVRDSLLHPGDRLTLDTMQGDPETAVHVILVRAGKDPEREAAGVPVDETRISTPDPGDFGRPHGTTESAAAPTGAAHDSDAPISSDDERPKLQRKPETETETAAAPAAPKQDDDSVDAVIGDAREEAENFSSRLPNFLVQQITTRYQGSRFVDNWRSMDVVTADVASVDGKEDYRNIKVNGRPTDRPEDSGSWSTGEFQITLTDVLSPRTAATFTPRGEDRIANRAAFVYALSVDQPHSHWTLQSDDGRQYKPAYKGSIWVDKETRRVLRIEQQAVGIPRGFAYDKAETSLEYGYVAIDGTRYLLPVQSVNVACIAGGNTCGRNVIGFRNYKKFSADTNITFGN